MKPLEHAEQVVNGVLCWLEPLERQWIPYTPAQLTRRLVRAETPESTDDDANNEMGLPSGFDWGNK